MYTAISCHPQRQRDAQKAQDAAWDLQLLRLSRAAEEEEKRTDELRRQKRIQIDRYNMQLARAQQAEWAPCVLYIHTPDFQTVASRYILGVGDEVLYVEGHFLEMATHRVFVSLSAAVRSTWIRRSTPTGPPRTIFINSTPAPADHHSHHTGLSCCASMLIKYVDCYIHLKLIESRVINTCWHKVTHMLHFY